MLFFYHGLHSRNRARIRCPPYSPTLAGGEEAYGIFSAKSLRSRYVFGGLVEGVEINYNHIVTLN